MSEILFLWAGHKKGKLDFITNGVGSKKDKYLDAGKSLY